MIDCSDYLEELGQYDINFFTGVPDSLLKDFCAYLTDHKDKYYNIISANEGNAVGLAAGHYLATGKIPVVYMQNSGIGNAVNPLLSLCDKKVYSIPVLIIIGWRGEPGIHDEPQHVKQGEVTLDLLEAMGIKHSVLDSKVTTENMKEVINIAYVHMNTNREPYAIVIRKGTFKDYKSKESLINEYVLTREDAIECIVDNIHLEDIIVSTTGKASREIFEIREKKLQGHEKDFLTVGSMGHSSQIALGIALAKPERQVYCLDGDGSMLMHMGSLAIIGNQPVKNFKHIILNNGSHESVGGQPTVAYEIDIQRIASACGYENVYLAKSEEELKDRILKLQSSDGPTLLEVRVNMSSRKDLGRPTTTPLQNKEAFMEFVVK